jgi:hypothetical protein
MTSMGNSSSMLRACGSLDTKLQCVRRIGAGEGIRTLDPDLGKVNLH